MVQHFASTPHRGARYYSCTRQQQQQFRITLMLHLKALALTSAAGVGFNEYIAQIVDAMGA